MRTAGSVLAALILPLGAGLAVVEAQTATVFNRPGSGARAAGMANAFIAVSDDGTAASWNPAGLGQLRKPELSAVTTTAHHSFAADGFRTRDDLAMFTSMRSSFSTTRLEFASLAVPVTIAGRPVTFQAAWHRLYDLEFRDRFSTARAPLSPLGPPPVLFEGSSETLGGVALFSAAAAVKLTSRLAVGAGFNHWRGDWTEHVVNTVTPLTAPGPSTFEMIQGANHLRGHSLSLGLMLTYPRWSVGLLRQGPLRSSFQATGTTVTSTGPSAGPGGYDATVHFPQALGLGVAWRPAAQWTVAGDVTWDEWTATRLVLTGGTELDLFDGAPRERSAIRNTLSASAGAERLFHGEGFVVPLRFGAAWEPQGQRDAYTRAPVNYVMLAAGTGYNTNSLKFDAAVQYRWARFIDGADFGIGDGDPLLPQAVGERSAREWRVKLSFILRVTDTEKLHRAIRKIFG